MLFFFYKDTELFLDLLFFLKNLAEILNMPLKRQIKRIFIQFPTFFQIMYFIQQLFGTLHAGHSEPMGIQTEIFSGIRKYSCSGYDEKILSDQMTGLYSYSKDLFFLFNFFHKPTLIL